MLATGVCFCIGEFGNWQNGADVDETTIMQQCTEKGVGYIAWSCGTATAALIFLWISQRTGREAALPNGEIMSFMQMALASETLHVLHTNMLVQNPTVKTVGFNLLSSLAPRTQAGLWLSQAHLS